jgi:cell division protein FtsI/penicillin-binding protein 2
MASRKKRCSMSTGRHRLRFRLLLFCFFAAYLAVAGRLVQIQLDPDVRFTQEELAHIGRAEIRVPRGDILDSRGVLLATDRMVPSLCANPSRIADPSTLALRLSRVLDLDEGEVLQRLVQKDATGRRKKFVWVKRFLAGDEAGVLRAAMEKDELAGLWLVDENVRFYPQNTVASHVLGFVNREGAGSEGVELTFDSYLRSEPGQRVSRVDSLRRILPSMTLEYEPPKGGDTLELTLDTPLQFSLERELDAALERTEAVRALGIIMEPATGAILAMACRPAYDPNNYTDFPPELYKNRGLVDVFEPGSAFKIVTASAAIEEGLITRDTMIDCENGVFNPYGHQIRDFHRLGVEPFHNCFAESSNIAMIKVGAMLEPDRLETWIRRFGFGHPTSSDFRSESRGIFRSRESWSRLSMGSLPMGQEIAVTMPQLVRAFSVIANGGYLVEPYVVERAINRDGVVTYQHDQEKNRQRVLSARTAQVMRELCHEVVTHGTGSYANIEEYRVGGKTGTAQVANPNGGGYLPDKYTAIFAGFAPVADPKLAAIIVIQEPGIDLHYGGYCAGPVFQKVVREALIRTGCPEDPVEQDVDAVVAENDADTVTSLDKEVEEKAPMLDGLELIPWDEDEPRVEPGLPSFAGMTKREARSRLNAMNVPWDVQGAGWVAEQDPPAGTPLSKVSVCRLVFKNNPAEVPERNTDPGTMYLQ